MFNWRLLLALNEYQIMVLGIDFPYRFILGTIYDDSLNILDFEGREPLEWT